MTPVILLTDGYIANAAEPWKVPDLTAVLQAVPCQVPRSIQQPGRGGIALQGRDEKRRASLDQAWYAGPDAPHRRHREGKSIRERSTIRPPFIRSMTDARTGKVNGVANAIPDQVCFAGQCHGQACGNRLGIDLRPDPPGRAPRAPPRAWTSAMSTCATSGRCRKTWAICCKGSINLLVPEMNTGQFKTVLRDQFLVDAQAAQQSQRPALHHRRNRSGNWRFFRWRAGQ